MLAMTYRDLSDIEKGPPLNAADRLCLEEIRDVLARHGHLARLGVTLLHAHFPIHEGEVLVETCDPERRQLQLEVKPDSITKSDNVIETSWRLGNGEALIGCYTSCVVGSGGHKRKHVTTR